MTSDEDLREHGLDRERRGPAQASNDANDAPPDPRQILTDFFLACDESGVAATDLARILTLGQVEILRKVLDGSLPVSTLGELAPGRRNALAPQQVIDLQSIMSDKASFVFVWLYGSILEHQFYAPR